MKLYRVNGSCEAKECFEYYVNFNCIYKNKDVAKTTLYEEVKKAIDEHEHLWEDVEDSKEEGLKWWLELHFEIIEVEIR